ncbi:molybdopterin synthase sulfur carrier subunit [Halobacteriales archaeon QS_3_64_16]|nr:MAG: molybdopterin synthase sulfur carrier subunit [Halobacteriales archaeon QS_3_64_16]
MDLTCRFFATFRQAVGAKTIEREFDDETTVGGVLSTLEAEYDDLDGRLLSEDGSELQPNINVLKNGRGVFHMDGPATGIEDGDTLSIFPPVAGGAGRAGGTDLVDDSDLAGGTH